jgi:hypothetical protein
LLGLPLQLLETRTRSMALTTLVQRRTWGVLLRRTQATGKVTLATLARCLLTALRVARELFVEVMMCFFCPSVVGQVWGRGWCPRWLYVGKGPRGVCLWHQVCFGLL